MQATMQLEVGHKEKSKFSILLLKIAREKQGDKSQDRLMPHDP